MICINKEKNIIEIDGEVDKILIELTSLVLGVLTNIREEKGLKFSLEYLSDLYHIGFETIIGISMEEYMHLQNAESTLEN